MEVMYIAHQTMSVRGYAKGRLPEFVRVFRYGFCAASILVKDAFTRRSPDMHRRGWRGVLRVLSGLARV